MAKNSFSWQWPAIAITVIAALAGIQLLRVNRPEETPVVVNTPSYSTPGSLLSGNLTIGAGEFLSTPITLNRRARLSGEFRTGTVKERVAVLVVDETNFEKWKQGVEFVSHASTGYVPGGRISPTLGPGNFFLVIDNRTNEKPQSVHVKFSLE